MIESRLLGSHGSMIQESLLSGSIFAAVTILRRGGLVAFPTETVYGLGADAANPTAVKKIFAAKGRPANHPLIVHIASAEQLSAWAQEIPDAAWALAERFWPGPLALVLPKRSEVPLEVTGGQPTVALRVPDNAIALELLNSFNGGIAAPSANKFNRISPTLAAHVQAELGELVDLVLDGGACRIGLESSIVDLSAEQPRLLRPGHISREALEAVLQASVSDTLNSAVRAPGMLDKHYAPVTPAALCATQELDTQAALATATGKRVGIMSFGTTGLHCKPENCVTMPAQAVAYGQAFYASLRTLDAQALDLILIEQPPDDMAWTAVNDRLRKATAAAT